MKKGYKLTEIGIIPQEWEVITIGELFNFKNGLNKEKHFFGQGTPIVNYMDVFKYRGLIDKNIVGKVTVTKQELSNYEVLKGDVFFTRTSETVEEIGITTVILEDLKDTVFSGFVLRARPKSNKLDNSFKQYCFSSSLVRKGIISTSSYTTRALTNGRLISNVKIPLPPSVSEQKAIAQALSDTDALITALEALIDKKRLIKQGTMQQLLTGKRRLEGFSGAWEVKRLGDIVDFLDGKRKPIKDSDRLKMQGEFPYYGASGIIDFINDYLFDDDLILLGEDGDNILSRNTRLAFKVFGKIWVNNHAHVLKPKSNIDIDFLTEYLESLNYELYNSGTAQPKLNQKTCANIPVLLPPSVSEQKAIAEILSEMDAEIAQLEAKRDKYKQLKQGMMQELLTGRIRLV